MTFKRNTIAVYRAIEQSWQTARLAPSLREIGEACHMAHVSVIRHLDKLEQGGYIEREPRKMRAIRIVKPLPHTALK